MKVLLLEDVYNLGRAGEIKKVANGYGRNYLIPQGLAMLATPGALKQAERIREEANKKRKVLNEEMAGVAEKLADVQLLFAARAGETGKLYGSVTTQMIANELTEKLATQLTKRHIDSEPLRLLGMHTVKVRLTVDLIPEISVVIYREGESPENYMIAAEELVAEAEEEYGETSIFEDVIGEEPAEEETPVEIEPESEANTAEEAEEASE
jgi:large subunit ribosomal protein L9